jgi:hypothetical protein
MSPLHKSPTHAVPTDADDGADSAAKERNKSTESEKGTRPSAH